MAAESASLKALKQLLRNRTIPQEGIHRFARELINKGPRTCAIMMGSLLDVMLEIALAQHIGEGHGRALTQRERDDLFGSDMPLGRLSAKITMAYSLRVVNAETRTKLEYIRHIRNVYAHTVQSIPFSRKELKDAVDVLAKGMPIAAAAKKSTKAKFLVAGTTLFIGLLEQINKTPFAELVRARSGALPPP